MKILWIVLLSVILCQSNIMIEDQYEIKNVSIKYGQYLQDAYMIISDIKTGEVYNEIIIDEGNDEAFIYLAEVENDQFIMVLEKYIFETDEYQYGLILYSIYGEVINRIDLLEKPNGFYNHHHVLIIEIDDYIIYVGNDLFFSDTLLSETKVMDYYIIQHQGQAFINEEPVEEIMIDEPGIYEIKIVSSQYEYVELITIEPKIIIFGDSYQNGYIGKVKIISKGDIYINGKEYTSGDIIPDPGIYEVIIFGKNDYVKTFGLTIYANLVYYDGDDHFSLTDGLLFDYPISIYSNADQIIVNGESYFGSLITRTGEYYIEIVVDDIVIETRNIFLISRVDGVKNRETYQEVSLYAFGEVILNDRRVEGYHLLTNPGTYKLRILNQDETYEEIEFYIKESNIENRTSLLPYGILVISMIGLGIIIFKK